MTDRQRGDGDGAGDYSLSPDTGFDCLGSTRRRHLIAALRGAAGPVAVADLADRVAEREAEGSADASAERREAVRCSLYHCHVPKLAAAGVVDRDRDRGTVEPTAEFERLVALWRSTFGGEESPQRDAHPT